MSVFAQPGSSFNKSKWLAARGWWVAIPGGIRWGWAGFQSRGNTKAQGQGNLRGWVLFKSWRLAVLVPSQSLSPYPLNQTKPQILQGCSGRQSAPLRCVGRGSRDEAGEGSCQGSVAAWSPLERIKLQRRESPGEHGGAGNLCCVDTKWRSQTCLVSGDILLTFEYPGLLTLERSFCGVKVKIYTRSFWMKTGARKVLIY